MTRLLFSGDWQVSLNNLDRCEVVSNQVQSILKKESTHFVFLGDAKDAFNPVDQRVTNFLIEHFTKITGLATYSYFIRGNHDNISVADDSPSCLPLIEKLGFSSWADRDWCFAVLPEETKSPRIYLYMVPFFRDPNRQKKAFRGAWSYRKGLSSAKTTVIRGSKHILAFHNEVLNCVISPARKGQAYSLADIGASDYDLCIGGHVHKSQFLKPNVHFVGSPFPMDWSEANFEHRLLLVEL